MNEFWVDLQFWRGIPWRRTVLMLTLAGLEMSWLTPIVMAFHPRSWGRSPLLYLLGLWLIMLLMMAMAHFMTSRQVDSPMFELGVVVAILAIAMIVTRLYVFWNEPITDFSWLRVPFQAGHPQRMQVFLLLATLAYLWWRGVTFLQRDIGFFVIGFDFRKGVLGLVAGVLLFTGLSGEAADVFVYPFFFFSLMAVALGRVEDKATATSGGEQPFGPEWVGILGISSLAVLAIAALFGLAWSLSGFSALGRAIAPAGSVLGQGVSLILLALLTLLEPFMEWLIRAIQENMPTDGQGPLIQLPADASELFGSELDTEVWQPSPLLQFIADHVLPVLIVAVVLVVLVLWLERSRRSRRRREREDMRERTDGVERAGMGGLMQAGLNRIRDIAGLVGQFGLGRRFYAAISVRNIYANVQRLAESRDYPRHQAQTPNDYLADLEAAFPGQEEALARITWAYNAYEYGEVPTDQAELEQLRLAWASVQAAAKQATPPSPKNAGEG